MTCVFKVKAQTIWISARSEGAGARRSEERTRKVWKEGNKSWTKSGEKAQLFGERASDQGGIKLNSS